MEFEIKITTKVSEKTRDRREILFLVDLLLTILLAVINNEPACFLSAILDTSFPINEARDGMINIMLIRMEANAVMLIIIYGRVAPVISNVLNLTVSILVLALTVAAEKGEKSWPI